MRSRGKQLVLFSRESWCFPRQILGKHQHSRENKTNWFPEGREIKCFVIFLDFHCNILQQPQKNTLSGANQNSGLVAYKNTNLILKTTEWMVYKVVSLFTFFPPSVRPLSTMLWSRVVMYPERGTFLNVSQSEYIWFSSRPRDQESAKGCPCLVEWKFRNETRGLFSSFYHFS